MRIQQHKSTLTISLTSFTPRVRQEQPKGVAIEHRNTVAMLNWARLVFTSDEITGVLASTSICFDLSVFELFVPLSWGGKIHLG